MNRILLGGLAGGVIMFFWGFVTHMLLPFGTLDVHQFTNEDSAIAAMKASAGDSGGVYLFPGLDMNKEPSQAEQDAWAARVRSGPRGMLVYRAEGMEPSMGRWLGIEFATNLAAALVAAFLLARIGGSYGSRVVSIGLLGLIAWLSINVSYWNWYAFPTGFVLGESVEQIGGWLLSGLAMAKIVPAQS